MATQNGTVVENNYVRVNEYLGKLMCHNSSFMRNSIIKAGTDSRLAEYRISDEVL